MATSVTDLVLRLTAKDDTSRAFRSAADSADHLDRKLTDVDGTMSKLSKWAGGLAIGAGLVAAGGAAARFGVQAAKAASDFGEVSSAIGQTFGAESAAQLQGWAKIAADTMGQSSTQALDAAKTFGVFGRAAGLAGPELVNFSTDLTGLAADLASFSNTSPEQAIEALGAALRGESEPIRAYGVLLDDATLKARAMEMGIYAGTGTLTQQQRVMAAYQEVLAQTTLQQGDFERTSGGMANQLRETSAQWTNLKTSAGQALVPIAEQYLPLINDSLGELKAWVDANQPAIQAALTGWADKVIDLYPEVRAKIEEIAGAVERNWPDIVDTAKNIGSALERVSGFVGTMWDAFRSLPPEVQQLIALLAVAQKTGVIDVAFKGAELVKGLVSNINAAVVNVMGGAPTGGVGGAVGKAGKAAPLVGGIGTVGFAGAAAVAASFALAGPAKAGAEAMRDATSAANVYASALEGARAKAGAAAGTTREFAGATSAAGGAMTDAGVRAAALSGAVGIAGQKAGLTQEQLKAMSAAVYAIPPGANAVQLGEAIRVAGQKAGLSDVQIEGLTAAALAVPAAANLPALQSAIQRAGAQAGWTEDQVRVMSSAVAAIPPGATAAQAGEAIRIAGQKAGLTDQQIRTLTGSIGAIPAAANLPALQGAITTAGRQAGWTDEQVRIMSSSVFAIPRGATAEQMGEAIRIAGQKAGLTDEQVRDLIASVNAIPPNKTANITTNADAERAKIRSLGDAISALSGKELSVTVKYGSVGTGVNGGGGAVARFGGGKSAAEALMSEDIAEIIKNAAPMIGPAGDIGFGPWVRPTSNYVVSSEWMRGGRAIHYGIDLAAPLGTPVHSVSAGRVTYAGWNNGYGNLVEVDHGGGSTSYAHLAGIMAAVGQVVGPGQVIGTVGSTGDSTGPHLHFETKPGYRAVEPRGFMASKGVSLRTGGMVPVNVSNGEWLVPAGKAAKHMPLLQAINAGQISGPGSGTSDSIRGVARAGDYVVNAKQSQRHRRLLRSITYGDGPSQYLSGGGVVGGSSSGSVSRTVVEVYLDGRLLDESLVRYRRQVGVA